MAKFDPKEANDIKGLVGNVVFTHWKNTPVIRSKPIKSTKPPTPQQLFQRAKMNAVMEFLRPYRPVVNTFFDAPSPTTTLHNMANSYYLKEVLVIDDTTLSIDLDKVILSKGGIRSLEDVALSTPQEGQVHLSWHYTPNEAGTQPNDALYVALYAPQATAGTLFLATAQRQHAQVTLQLPPTFVATPIHLWAGFITPDGSQASWSVYVGSLE
jgi:hypothetical protein